MVDWTRRMARRARDGGDPLGGILALANAEGVLNFSGGFPDPSLFPTGELGDITRRLLDDDPGVALQYAPSNGIESARHAMIDWLSDEQGHRAADDELMITSGGIDAVTLIARTMLDPGDVVLVEEPTYLGAVSGFAAHDPVLRGVELDEDGLDVGALGELLAAAPVPPKLLYTIPDHQNPSGRSLSEVRRSELVELCRRHGVLIVEDVAYRHLGFDGTASPSLWSIGPDVVVQIGTFSKVFFPGVRLGWASGPAEIVAKLAVAKQNSDQCAGALGQRMLEEYLRGGLLDAHLPKARALYRDRAAAVDAALRAHFAELGEWTAPAGGFFTWVRLPGVDTTELAAEAAEHAVAYVPGAGFFAERPDAEHLRLSFSRIEVPEIEQGIAALGAAVRGLGSGARR
ncbi:PLP-dependent aminotransferase family protein [Saccharopolyspora griseoalba]|uniref:PLP-dependent aminotransferase family protein n=1 Tax=Saccharopolyspora griseoalba TaxID=1431848 RepID=A0ABW2LRP3_9PSEU